MKDIFRIKRAITVGLIKGQELTQNMNANKSEEERKRDKERLVLESKEKNEIEKTAVIFESYITLSGDFDVVDCFERIFKHPGMCKFESGAPVPAQIIDGLSIDDMEKMSGEYAAFFMSKSAGNA